MRKLILTTIVIIGLLLIASIIPANLGSSKTMDPVDGKKRYVGTTTSPPILDGIVNVGSTWQSSQWVGGARVAMNNTDVADVYMVVEVDIEDVFQYLWIGVKPISPYTFKPTEGQWLRIDWDRDGKLDYEDHTGWGVTDGADTTGGAEWMIPWGKNRVNPGQTPFIMDPTLVGSCFDILIHLELWKDGSSISVTFPPRPNPKPGEFLSTTFCVQFSPPPDDGDDWGIRSMGFWKHQLRTALGSPGHQHVPTDNLTTYLDQIDQNSEVPELQGLTLRDALMLLEIEGLNSDMYSKVVQQLLALWFNYLSDGDQMVDKDNDGTNDTLLSTLIDDIEDILLDPNSSKQDLEKAKNWADTVNNS
jgi:hypothetical protein